MNSTERIPLFFGVLFSLTIAFTGQAQDARGIDGTAPGGNAGARKYAVIVGLNAYTDSGIGTLKYAVADAEGMHHALTTAPDGFKPEHTVLLADSQPAGYRPTRSNILKYLSSYINLAGPDDTILVYFAGHGTTVDNRLYLLPSDASISLLEDTSIAFERVKTMLEESPAKRKVLLLDACHSGAGRSINRMSQGLKEQLLEASKGMVTLASCGPEEVSHEMDESGHGAFTYFLLEGLSGKADANNDGLIGAKELSTFTWDATRVWAAGKGLKQNPWDLTQVSGDIVLAKVITVTGGPKAGDVDVVDLGGGVKLELVYVPAGTFMMGSPESEEERSSDEGPVHEVTISRGFWMGKYEVTQGQWQKVMGTTLAQQRDKVDKVWPLCGEGPNNPMIFVTWNECQEFLGKVSSRTGETYRLPTEAEWEYGCRAGTRTPFYFGVTISADQANYDGDYTYGSGHKGMQRGETTPVGIFPANAFGLYDMHGNAWEWCGDWYHADYYQQSSKTDPTGPGSGDSRVLRGGSWWMEPWYSRSAARSWHSPSSTNFLHGFRVVRVSPR